MPPLLFDTSLIRFLAILLIINSHLDLLYPDPRFATGGALGNALFFALSGFGLAMSAAKELPNFSSWISRRLLKIYPQVILVTLLGGLATSIFIWWPLGKLLQQFIWPTNYWFVAAIVVFYIPIYLVFRFAFARIFYVIAISAIPYIWFYFTELNLNRFSVEDDPFRWLFYFPVMLFGAYLASSKTLKAHKTSDALVLTLIVIGYLSLKLFISKGFLGDWQFTVQLLTFPFVFYSIRLFANPFFLNLLKKWKLYFFIAFLGELSLEVYLVQGFLIRWLANTEVSILGSIFLIWPLIFMTAWPISLVCKKLVSLIAPQRSTAQSQITPSGQSEGQT